jgi:hypothetical protein
MNTGVKKQLLTNKRSSVDYCKSRRRERRDAFLSRNSRNSKNVIS